MDDSSKCAALVAGGFRETAGCVTACEYKNRNVDFRALYLLPTLDMAAFLLHFQAFGPKDLHHLHHKGVNCLADPAAIPRQYPEIGRVVARDAEQVADTVSDIRVSARRSARRTDILLHDVAHCADILPQEERSENEFTRVCVSRAMSEISERPVLVL